MSMPLCRYLVLLIRSIHEEGYAMRHIIVRDKPQSQSVRIRRRYTRMDFSSPRRSRWARIRIPFSKETRPANGTRAGKLEGDSHARWTNSLSGSPALMGIAQPVQTTLSQCNSHRFLAGAFLQVAVSEAPAHSISRRHIFASRSFGYSPKTSRKLGVCPGLRYRESSFEFFPNKDVAGSEAEGVGR